MVYNDLCSKFNYIKNDLSVNHKMYVILEKKIKGAQHSKKHVQLNFCKPDTSGPKECFFFKSDFALESLIKHKENKCIFYVKL